MNWVVGVPRTEANVKLKELLAEAGKSSFLPLPVARIHLSGTLFLDTEIYQLLEDWAGDGSN